MLDEEFARDQQEIVDNEKEKQVIEGELSQAKEDLEATGKYLKLLQCDNANLTSILRTTKDTLQHSMSLQLVQEVQIQRKEILGLEESIADIVVRINKAKLELQSIREQLKVLTESFSELCAQQKGLQERKCELLAALRQHEEGLNRALQAESPFPHPSPEKDEVLIRSNLMPYVIIIMNNWVYFQGYACMDRIYLSLLPFHSIVLFLKNSQCGSYICVYYCVNKGSIYIFVPFWVSLSMAINACMQFPKFHYKACWYSYSF